MEPGDRSISLEYHPGAGSVAEFGGFRFDRANKILSGESGEISLPPRVLAVLDFLIDRAGRVVSKEALLDGVWEGSHVTETSPAEAVSLLRQALGDDPQNPRYVQTVHRRGYRFVAPLTWPEAAALGPRVAASGTQERASFDRSVQPPLDRRVRAILGGVAVGALAFALGWTLRPSSHPLQPPAARFSVSLPSDQLLLLTRQSLALSPDGRRLAINTILRDPAPDSPAGLGGDRRPDSVILLRSLDSHELVRVAGSEGASGLFFSPDGRWLAFFEGGRLVKLPVGGGRPTPIAAAAKGVSGSWGPGGSIVFNRSLTGGLWKVSADGGEPERLTTPDAAAGEVAHVSPWILPDGRALLYTVWSTTQEDTRVAAYSLSTGREVALVQGAAHPAFVPPDRLLFVRSGALFSAPFDPDRLRVTGPAEPISYGVAINPAMALGMFTVANNGVFAYQPGEVPVGERQIAWLDADGSARPLAIDRKFYRNLVWSPTAGRFAATALDGDRSDIWVGDADPEAQSLRSALRRLTFDGFNIEPAWSADGRWLSFASNRDGPFGVFRRPGDGSAPAERVAVGGHHVYPDAWHPSAEVLLASSSDPETGFDLWRIERRGEAWEREPFLVTSADELFADWSPDGRWIAYGSNASGEHEIYVRPAEGRGGPWQVSQGGGYDARWSPDGSELYFFGNSHLLAASFEAGPEVRFGPPEPLFDATDVQALQPVARRRFLAILERYPDDAGAADIEVVVGESFR